MLFIPVIKTTFSASLLLSSVSHDPPEIIFMLICCSRNIYYYYYFYYYHQHLKQLSIFFQDFLMKIQRSAFIWNKSESDVTCGQVWWPILWICALHLSHPVHTQQWTHTHTHTTHTHPEQWAAIYAAEPGEQLGVQALLKGTSVEVLRVERVLYIHSPYLQFLPDLRLEPATFGLWVRLSAQY